MGTTEHEMGASAPKGEFTDMEQGSQETHDTLSYSGKSMSEENAPVVNYEGGMLSPVDGVSFADDEQKASVEISDEDGVLANFSCDIADNMREKVAGLQTYSGLKETAGLVFSYKKPEDVIYHMGTVSFPIDIIFIDASHNVKKIYKNIEPGTLGTFGCGNVKNVLEICGGLSDRLGISIGHHVSIAKGRKSELPSVCKLNKISSQLGINKDVIVQYSNVFRGGFHNWNEYPILSISDNLNKFANKNQLISDLVRNFTKKEDNRNVYAFDFDGLIEDSPMVRVYKTSEVANEEVPYIRIDGHTVSINKTDDGSEIYRDVHLYEITPNAIQDDESILASLNKSFAYFLNSNKVIEDTNKIFQQVRKEAFKSDSRVIIVTRSPNPEYLKAMVCTRLALQFGDTIDMEVVSIEKEADAQDIIKTLRKTCGNQNIQIFSDESLLKRAGTPVPDLVKQRAKKIYKLLEEAKSLSKKSVDNIKSNLTEYDKIKNNPEAIAKTKGQYHQSVRNNTRLVKGYLVKLRDAIRDFNEIKDISTTTEITDGLASSARIASDTIEEIFDLIELLNSPDFNALLSGKTSEYERVIEDLHSSIDRGTGYINDDILGLLILSD